MTNMNCVNVEPLAMAQSSAPKAQRGLPTQSCKYRVYPCSPENLYFSCKYVTQTLQLDLAYRL
uniref:Uncharacterized protein n=1 Tax=Anguilla anguilla TaxID=7936 RepID=A0A0E9QHG1_ANGAN